VSETELYPENKYTEHKL